MPKRILHGKLASGSRNRGTKERFKERVKTSLPFVGVPPKELETRLADRISWRRTVYEACKNRDMAFREKQSF